MALIINNNLMAANASRNLGSVYSKLSTSTQRLSSGLRVNSAADDAAGLAIREMMRADIAVTQQGIRNAADAVSLIQTADGALAVIDEKLTRMKELAEQAATGTYTTVQRDIINSEYQAMAAEIDRIASATNFNGIKLLDGSINQQHGGQGLKVHFGVSNNPAEDYYFINIGDARATSATGLRVGGDATNDIWAQGGAASHYGRAEGCCSGGFTSLNGAAGFTSGQLFSFGYNWDWQADDETKLAGGKYTAGVWQVGSSDSLQNLLNRVNQGTQSRVGIAFSGAAVNSAGILGDDREIMSAFAICVGNESYVWGSAGAATASMSGAGKLIYNMTGASAAGTMGKALTSAINHNSDQFWAMWDSGVSTCYVFSREGGDNNSLTACEQGIQLSSAKTSAGIAAALGGVSFENVATGITNDEGATFSLGGEKWGTMRAVQTGSNANELWNVVLEGRDVGDGRDLWIANIGSGASFDLTNNSAGAVQLYGMGQSAVNIGNLGRDAFSEVQNAANANWKGAEIRTQSSAQEALDALTDAITKKDKIRADLGALQNRLENTMTNLEIQAENLQAAESRISDVDVAKEMTEFTKNNVLAQAATSMLAQANSMSQLALTLIR